MSASRLRKHANPGYLNDLTGTLNFLQSRFGLIQDAMTKPGSLAHTAYLVTIAVKGFDGALETLAGLLILLTGPQRLYHFAVRVTAPELGGDHEQVALAIRNGAHHLAINGAGFIIFYLLVHGLLKLGIAAALLRGKGRWIFPVSAIVLVGFIIFMVEKLTHQWSWWLFGFAMFDGLTLVLVLNEWRQGAKTRN
jgi:uncharacterized membrane protein